MQYKLFNDHFQNYKVYNIPKAQLVIADIPYNIGKNAYGSNPAWYVDGDNKNGESDEGDVVIDPVAGSGSTLLAAMNMNRKAYGFEIKKNFYNEASKLLKQNELKLHSKINFNPEIRFNKEIKYEKLEAIA